MERQGAGNQQIQANCADDFHLAITVIGIWRGGGEDT